MKIKVLVAEDHPIFREGLICAILKEDKYKIVAETGDGLEAFNLIKKEKPDIALLDISMPNMNGLEIAREIQKENLKVKCILLTMHKERDFLNSAVEAGVKGYVLKDEAPQNLLEALKIVSGGKRYISPFVSEYLLEKNETAQSLKDLTPSEKRVLKLIAENKTSKEIADELCVSYRTVQTHRTNICTKLNLSGMNKLLRFAIENKSFLD